jgi:hypothetical protein
MYATTIIHGTAYTVLHVAIEMQIAFFFSSLVFLIDVNQLRLPDVNEEKKKEKKVIPFKTPFLFSFF